MQIPKDLQPMIPSTASALSSERSKTQFDIPSMHTFIVDSEMRRMTSKIEKVLDAEPEIFNMRNIYFMSRQEKMDHAMKIGLRLIQLMHQGVLTAEEIPIADMILDLNGPFGLHRA
ncbi:hypothetical protein LPJ66_011363, partial [Kickxella alabastrina]